MRVSFNSIVDPLIRVVSFVFAQFYSRSVLSIIIYVMGGYLSNTGIQPSKTKTP